MIKIKICQGKGKSKGYGCLKELKYSEFNGIKTYYQKFGLGHYCGCYAKYLLETEHGQNLILKASKKAGIYSAKESRKQNSERKWELKSYAQKIQDVRRIVQLWVRNRDKNKPCISCGTPYSEIWDAGHYMKAELYSGVVFDENNIHKQCRKCNHYLGGNEAQYRLSLCKLYGEEKVIELEEKAKQKRMYKYTDSELIDIKQRYKIKNKTEFQKKKQSFI